MPLIPSSQMVGSRMELYIAGATAVPETVVLLTRVRQRASLVAAGHHRYPYVEAR